MLKSNLKGYSKLFIELTCSMSPRERKLIIERFDKKKSLKEVGVLFKISDARVKEIEDKLIQNIENTFYEFNNRKIQKKSRKV